MKIKDYILVLAVIMTFSLKSQAQITVLSTINCNGDSTGTLMAVPSGWGISPFTYLWSTSDTIQVVTNLTAGNYFVTITDSLGVDSVFNMLLTQPTLLTTMMDPPTNVSCFNGYDGSATVIANGGTFPYFYNWSNGTINASATSLSSGTYFVTVTDYYGCTSSKSVLIAEPSQLTSNIVSSTNVTCNGGANGSAIITAIGGIPGYLFNWSNGSTNSNIVGLSAGNYKVTVTDNNGCVVTNSVLITEPSLINLPITNIVNVSCFGGNNGSLTVIANGGSAPYSYSWSNGSNATSIDNLIAGLYTLTVTDNASCTKTISANIIQPAPLSINIIQIIPSSCDGQNNGSAQIAVIGGTPPYLYNWREITTDSIYTTQNIAAVRGGTYELTVTDFMNCSIDSVIIIPNLAVVPVTVTHPSYICNGALGIVNIRADSADSAQYYTYQWSSTYNTGSFTTNDSIFSISTSFLAGNYTITITENATSCAAYYNFTINQSATPLVVTSIVSHNNCYGNLNGSIRLFVNGGDPLPTNQVTWTGPNGFTSNVFSIAGLASGDYNYTVADDSACTVSGTIRIMPLTPLQGYTTKSDISCNGNINGSISAFYNGGTGTIKYLWSNGNATPQINNLSAGIYSLTVTDSLGCIKIDTVQINEPSAMVTTLNLKQDVSCYGYSDGLLSTTTTGGIGPLQYSWLLNGSLFPEVTNNIINIPAGIYQLTVTDSLFCKTIFIDTVDQPLQTIFNDSVHMISCNNGADGYWSITPSGIYTPYIAIFSTGDTISTDTVPSPYINGLNSGFYSCHIIASNGCEWDFTVTFIQPLPITVGLSNIIPVNCYGDSTGSITLDNVHGGTSTYTFAWSNGASGNPLINVPSGIYNVVITDSKNCTIDETYTVEQPFEPIKFFPTITPTSCQQAEDGQIVVYQENIYWSPFVNTIYIYNSTSTVIDTAATGQIIGNLPPGNYTIVLENEKGCRAEAAVFIDKSPEDCIQIPNMVTANDDGYNDVFRVQGGCKYESFKIIIFNDKGKSVFDSEDCNFIWDPKQDLKVSANTVFYYYITVMEDGRTYEFRNSININY